MSERFHRALRSLARAWRGLRAGGTDSAAFLLHTLEVEYGHGRSVRYGLPVDREGRPLPWFTYAAIDYLGQLDLSTAHLFEFGAGLGSLWLSQRVASIVSVESDPVWHAQLDAVRADRHTLLLRVDHSSYVAALPEAGRRFDVIIVDGRWRADCARAAIEHLAEGGLIILDNSDWYPEVADRLRQADLLQVDFSGPGPRNLYTWTTSLFFSRSFRVRPRGQRLPEAPRGGCPECAPPD